MSLTLEKIEALFPKELTEQRKGRLREGLKQFLSTNSDSKLYTNFYLSEAYSHFLQGDMINDLRYPSWDKESKNYVKNYFNVVVISNSCDIDEANQSHRGIPKQVLISKLFKLTDFQEGLIQNQVENSENIIKSLKNQEHSNLMYFPPIDGVEYIAFLDELSWVTNDELNLLKSDIKENRIASLDYFGYYLFMFKLSYHLCRLPEDIER